MRFLISLSLGFLLLLGYCLYLGLNPRPKWVADRGERFLLAPPELGLMVSQTEENNVRLREVRTGKVLLEHPLLQLDVLSSKVSPNQRWLAFFKHPIIGMPDLHLIDLLSRQLWSVDPKFWFYDLHFSSDSRFLAISSVNQLQVYDLTTRKNLLSEKQQCLGFAAGHAIFANGENSPPKVTFWDPVQQKTTAHLKNLMQPRLILEKEALLVSCSREEFDPENSPIQEIRLVEIPSGNIRKSWVLSKGFQIHKFSAQPKPLGIFFQLEKEAQGIVQLEIQDLLTGHKEAEMTLAGPDQVSFSPRGRWVIHQDDSRKTTRFLKYPSLRCAWECSPQIDVFWFDPGERFLWCIPNMKASIFTDHLVCDLESGMVRNFKNSNAVMTREGETISARVGLIQDFPTREPSMMQEFLDWLMKKSRPGREIQILSAPFENVEERVPLPMDSLACLADEGRMLITYSITDKGSFQLWVLPLRKPWEWIVGIPVGVGLVGWMCLRWRKSAIPSPPSNGCS